jgi:GAF domain-containing protein
MQQFFGEKNIIPENDDERVNTLQRYLEAIPQGYFTNLATIMAKTFDASIALVSFVDKDEVIFNGNIGMEDTTAVSRGLSLCSLAILDQSPTVIENALEEPCLLANPLVTESFGLRFYAGAPIVTKDGYAIGTACIVGKEPRKFSKEDKEILQYFAHVAMREVELRYLMLEKAEIL